MIRDGTVVTFYSYKGGVGRTFALANIAVHLGRWGFKVLCIDWDLEAPGLPQFFDIPDAQTLNAPGLVELLSSFRGGDGTPLPWQDYVIDLGARSAPSVSLISSGLQGAGYSGRLQKLNWSALYRRGLGNALEVMFEDLRQAFDFVLIDARTGITDFAGIITAQLPDILLFLFTANNQSFEGATDVARRAVNARNGLALDRARLMTIPVPARFEAKVEHAIAVQWRNRYATDLTEFYRPWAERDVPIARLVQATTIPYVPFWSFGERLSVVEEDTSDPLSVNHSLETLAAMLAHRLGETKLLAVSRDEFVGSARRLAKRSTGERSVFISYQKSDAALAHDLQQALAARGFDSFFDVQVDPVIEWTASIAAARHMIVVLRHPVRLQENEIRTFLRQAAVDGTPRLLIPLAMGKLNPSDLPAILRNYVVLRMDEGVDRAAAQIAGILDDATADDEPKPATRLPVHVTDSAGRAVGGAHVRAIASSGRRLDAVTTVDGAVELELGFGETFTLLVASPLFLSRVIDEFTPGLRLDIELDEAPETGSTIIDGSGIVQGLAGLLTFVPGGKRTARLSASGLSIDGSRSQAVDLRLGQAFALEADDGARVEARLTFARAGTWLLEHRRLPTSAALLHPGNRPKGYRVYLSYHHEGDVWRAAQIANLLAASKIDIVPGFDAFTWEAMRRQGDGALRSLILERIRASDCIVVLVGSRTAEKRWVLEEIREGWLSGKGVLGIRIDALSDGRGQPARPGADPFVQLASGSLSDVAETARLITPEGSNGAAVLASIQRNLGSWVATAVRDRRNHP